MTQWEYMGISDEYGGFEKLNELGAEGWELVLHVGSHFVFKRRIGIEGAPMIYSTTHGWRPRE